MDSKSDMKRFYFFQLPYHLQIEIIYHLSLKDTRSFAVTSKESNLLANDQQMWRKKLWHLAKAVNLSLETRRDGAYSSAEILTQDPLLVDMKRMYEILGPALDRTITCEVDMENLLSKYDPPSIMTFTSLGLQEILDYFKMFFIKPRPRLFHDPFSKGEGAPTFLLFGPPESSLSRKLGLSFIASKDAMFETVGLVRGRPGGLGGGVTVKMGSRLMNFLPVRRARRLRLLLDKPTGTEFHPDVAEVASNVDGLIYYMDAKCECEARRKTNPQKPTMNSSQTFQYSKNETDHSTHDRRKTNPQKPTMNSSQTFQYFKNETDHSTHDRRKTNPQKQTMNSSQTFQYSKNETDHSTHHGHPFKSSWQTDSTFEQKDNNPHNLDHEFHELQAMLKALPESVCSPILVILIRQSKPDVAEGGAVSESPTSEEEEKGAAEGEISLHKPSDLYHRLAGLKNPWMATTVQVPSLDGVRQGVHWIYERTLLLKKGRS